MCDFRDYAFVCDVPERLIPYTDPELLREDMEVSSRDRSAPRRRVGP